jgi:hypothetical protein
MRSINQFELGYHFEYCQSRHEDQIPYEHNLHNVSRNVRIFDGVVSSFSRLLDHNNYHSNRPSESTIDPTMIAMMTTIWTRMRIVDLAEDDPNYKHYRDVQQAACRDDNVVLRLIDDFANP